MRLISLLILFFTGSLQLTAQRICVTHEYNVRNQHTVQILDQTTTAGSHSRDTVANEIITIPVVVHVLYHTTAQNISTSQILSQLKVLNEDFRRMNADATNTPDAFKSVAADAKVMFCLAQINPAGRPASGIVRKFTTKEYFSVDDAMKFSAAGGDDAWDNKKYLNIWVCNIQNNVLGYASNPGSQADKDGVVIQFDAFGNTGTLRPSFNKGRTATHEIAHWMGLKHIWGDNNCGDDGIGDTPQQSGYNNNCPSFPHMSSCSPDANGDMFMNFMDYTSDACMNIFTEGQKTKMRGLFALHNYRNSFLSSFTCDSTLATAAPLPATDTSVAVKPMPTVRIFPNPVHSDFGFAALNGYSLEGKQFLIMSANGEVLIKKTILNATDKVNVSALHSGIYIIQIGQGSERVVLKLIKV
jgi:hypothetical protein